MILQFYVSKPVRSTATSNVRGAYEGADALHAVYSKKASSNFKIYERAYHASKFSGELL